MHAVRTASSSIHALALAAALAAGCAESKSRALPAPAKAAAAGYSEAREACADRNPLKSAWFGDLHVHTTYSMDVWPEGVKTTPADAYRFARGEAIPLVGGRTVQLERPLDFTAVTDHSEWLGEVRLCTEPGSQGYASHACRIFRGEIPAEGPYGSRMAALSEAAGPVVMVNGYPDAKPRRVRGLCGEAGTGCEPATAAVWEETKAAAEAAYDRTSACRFTSFVAYEYSYTPQMAKTHRNVIFRNDRVPPLPISWLDANEPKLLWQALAADCLDAGTGCDVLAIPHNPNLSNGRMFTVEYRDLPLPEQVSQARLRRRLEPLLEMMQIKGESECRNGFRGVTGDADEYCDFEKFRPAAAEDCGEKAGAGAMANRGCTSRLDFARYAIVEGMREEERIGVNPYQVGFIGSTDTHNSTPGDTEETSYEGAGGEGEITPLERLANRSDSVVPPARPNPGGLAGVWAEENSRDALFEAMQRRETFATSGTRIRPRLFAGWDYPADLCQQGDLVAQGYARGVPMGGDLPPRPADAKAPVLVAAAERDPGSARVRSLPLERLQIVKMTAQDDGRFRQRIFDVAVSPERGSVDPATCEIRVPRTSGSLCAVWRDPEFDPAQRAVYYARVLEAPSCRWSALQCLSLPAAERPPACSDPAVPKVVRERAWTSPVWYTPG